MASPITAFTYKKKLMISTSGVGINSTLTGFPVCVDINSLSWPASSERDHFFGAYNVGGERIQFFASDQVTNLTYQVASYDQTGKTAVYWVRATLTGNSTTNIYVAYGNDPNNSSQSGNPWSNSDYFLVCLMDEPREGNFLINSAIGGWLESYGDTVATGYVGTGREYTENDVSQATNFNDLDPNSPCSLSVWVKTASTSTLREDYLNWGGLTGQGRSRILSKVYQDGEHWIAFNSNGILVAGETHPALDNSWEHWGFSCGGSYSIPTTDVKIYRNGVDDGLVNLANGTSELYAILASDAASVGSNMSGNFASTAILDEARICTTARSADWFKGEYYSMKKTSWNGDNWATWSSEQSTNKYYPLPCFRPV